MTGFLPLTNGTFTASNPGPSEPMEPAVLTPVGTWDGLLTGQESERDGNQVVTTAVLSVPLEADGVITDRSVITSTVHGTWHVRAVDTIRGLGLDRVRVELQRVEGTP